MTLGTLLQLGVEREKLHHAYSALLSGFSLKEIQIFKRNFLAIIVCRDFVLRY